MRRRPLGARQNRRVRTVDRLKSSYCPEFVDRADLALGTVTIAAQTYFQYLRSVTERDVCKVTSSISIQCLCRRNASTYVQRDSKYFWKLTKYELRTNCVLMKCGYSPNSSKLINVSIINISSAELCL